MKEFDIEKIGKKMPYAPLEEGYFNRFQQQMLVRLEVEGKKRTLRRKLYTSVSAAVMVGVVVSAATFVSKSYKATFVASAENKVKVDNFIDNLTDDELALILAENELTSEFYANL